MDIIRLGSIWWCPFRTFPLVLIPLSSRFAAFLSSKQTQGGDDEWGFEVEKLTAHGAIAALQ